MAIFINFLTFLKLKLETLKSFPSFKWKRSFWKSVKWQKISRKTNSISRKTLLLRISTTFQFWRQHFPGEPKFIEFQNVTIFLFFISYISGINNSASLVWILLHLWPFAYQFLLKEAPIFAFPSTYRYWKSGKQINMWHLTLFSRISFFLVISCHIAKGQIPGSFDIVPLFVRAEIWIIELCCFWDFNDETRWWRFWDFAVRWLNRPRP